MADTVLAASVVTRHSCLSQIARRPVWTVPETALVLRCDPATVRRELYRGAIVGVRIANEWRIPASQFGALTRALRASQSPEDGDPGRRDTVLPISQARWTPAHHHATDHNTPNTPNTPNSPDAFNGSEACKPARPVPVLRLYLFGRPRVYIDEVRMPELDNGSRRGQVIELLALHRSGLGAEQLASSLKMASHRYEDESLSTNYVRTLTWGVRQQAREKTGWEGIIGSPIRQGSGLHRYQLPDNSVCDLWEFEDRLVRADRLAAAAAAQVSRASVLPGPQGAQEPHGQGSPEQDKARSALEEAAGLREEALQLYKGEFCEGTTNGCLAQAARVLEERYKQAAVQQGDYWRAMAQVMAKAMEKAQATHASAATPGAMRVPIPPDSSTCTEVRTIWREALRNYERVLQVDYYHEEACMHAMECYAHLGNARGVGLVFNRYRDALGADLLEAPGAAVVRAYRDCKSLASSRAGSGAGIR